MEQLIRAVIGRNETVQNITGNWVNVHTALLPQEYTMIFITDQLFCDITELYDEKYNEYYPGFTRLTTPVIHFLEDYSFRSQLVYIETDYCFGYGSQAGVLFENGKISDSPLSGEGAVNKLLKIIGVWCVHGKDEFDSMGLYKYRKMP
ncbi:MAG: hypothetical protein K1W24_02035 [Lachnospiraceae bacterium]